MFAKAVQDFEVSQSGEGDLATAVIYWQSGFLAEELIKLRLASQALEHFDGLIQRRPPKTELEMGIASQMIALCYSELDLDQAEIEYKKMLDHYQKADFEPLSSTRTELLAQAYFDISKFYINKKRFGDAIVYLKKIERESNGIFTLSRQRDLQMMLFKIDSVSGNFLSAIEHFRIQQSLNDSIISIAKARQFAELEIQYETDKKENEITLLQNKSQLQESRLNLTIAGVVLLLLAITLLFGRYWMKQKSNKKLLAQQIEIKQKNTELSNLLDEKDWLVKEVHHRVKNNLQMVISLLNSQSSYLSNHDAVVAIKESQRRMHAMSLIHQRLYEKTGSTIDMQTYIADLINYFKDSFDCTSVQFKLDVEPVMLDVSQAVPVGLILNEAITNSLKYAFPDGLSGNILVAFKLVSSLLELTIADDGIGFPATDNVNSKKSLGMSLQKGLAEQIGGSYKLRSEKGTEILIKFTHAEIGKNVLHDAFI
jgi:two-component sensor histidine kinase